MKCKKGNNSNDPCYFIPNMKEVRANFLLATGQKKRLDELIKKVNESGLNVFYYKNIEGTKGRIIIEKPQFVRLYS